MNLPNKLTIFRVILIVPFVVALLGGDAGWFGENLLIPEIVALAIFISASLTVMIDGKIARKYNLITNFGIFMDPLADKLLVCSALICLVELGQLPAWMVIVIVSREFIISGFRLVAAEKGVTIAANYWGKVKTVVQMIMSILLIFDFRHPVFRAANVIFVYAAVILTVISLVDYIYKNRDIMKDVK